MIVGSMIVQMIVVYMIVQRIVVSMIVQRIVVSMIVQMLVMSMMIARQPYKEFLLGRLFKILKIFMESLTGVIIDCYTLLTP